MKTIEKIYQFIQTAERNRKYPSNTAIGYRTALNKVKTVLNEDETNSVDVFQERFEQIFGEFANKYKSEMSAESMNVYRKRILKVLYDIQTYGDDPTKWSTWNVAISQKTQNVKQKISEKNIEPMSEKEQKLSQPSSSTNFRIPLTQDREAIVITPSDITKSEGEKIKRYIEFVISIAQE